MNAISLDDMVALRNSGQFDAEWYLSEYPDVRELGIDPAEHYLRIGKRLGRAPSRQSSPSTERYAAGLNSPAPFNGFGVIKHDPLISVIVVSFNSSVDLKALFPTISNQTHRNFEVILIENGDENNRPLLKKHFDRFQYLKADNVGFAEANNMGARAASGELLALINPDTRLAPDAVQNLLDGLRYDESAAVAVPKINFFERFVHLELRANAQFSIRREDLLRGLAYRKLFVRAGAAKDDLICSDEHGVLAVDVPYEAERTIKLGIESDQQVTRCEARVGYSEKIYFTECSDAIESIELSLSNQNCSSARYLVNNAGSSFHADGTPYDRGFGEFDEGAFFSKTYVGALCGCAALIRRTVVLDREIFAAPFFAYYEDSELSNWLGEHGHRILYQPAAEVFHRHSESTEENSLLWSALVGRSRRLFDFLTRTDALPLSLFHFDYPEAFQGPLRQKLGELDRRVQHSKTRQEVVGVKRRTACIYNTYFSSMGGGEKHALDIASILREDFDVYLVSEANFDIAELEKYFSVDLSGVRKIVSTRVDTWFTSKFDLFVNSTFRSNLRPAAATNFYIVSFPHADIARDIVRKYRFFHNSPFTADWAKELWGWHDARTILPILGEYKAVHTPVAKRNKKKEIISVGRFTYEGHCKNHHLVLDAYKRMIDAEPALGEWKLRLLGSCDHSRDSAIQYLSDLRQSAKGYNVDILPNVDREVLDRAYTTAAIYVHGAGLGVSRHNPELHEHFGITTFEALAHGCLPVVYSCGGPATQVQGLAQSKTFKDALGLEQSMRYAIGEWEGGRIRPTEIQDYARAMHDENQQFAQGLLRGVSADAD